MFHVTEPLTVYIFSKEQLAVVKYMLEQQNHNFVTLHLDATGSVVHCPPPTKKRVYYYAGVVHIIDKETVCPPYSRNDYVST